MSHKEDQNLEVEALQSIYANEIESNLFIFLFLTQKKQLNVKYIEVVETEPFHSLKFNLKSEKYDQNPDEEGSFSF